MDIENKKSNLIEAQNQLSDFISLNELTVILNCSKSFIYKLTSNKEIPFYKPSKNILFSKREIFEWINSSRVTPTNELIKKHEESFYLIDKERRKND